MAAKKYKAYNALLLLSLVFVLIAGQKGFCQDSKVSSTKSSVSGNNTSRSKSSISAEHGTSDSPNFGKKLVHAELVANRKSIQAGKAFMAGVKFKMEPGWHIYYKNSGDSGMPTQIEWILPDGFSAGPLLWQEPKHFDDDGIKTNGYVDSTFIASQITVPADLKDLKTVDIEAKVKWLSCKESCIPGKDELHLTLLLGQEISDDTNAQLFSSVGYEPGVTSKQDNTSIAAVAKSASEGTEQNPLNYFLLAMVGGFILNFMPCVLPVIAIKILSFMEQADESPARVRQLGLVFSSGVISAFLALALVVVAIRAAGNSVGWGTQFQNPLFLIVMCVIVLILALSLFGLFYFSFDAGQDKLDTLAKREGMVGTFFKGVLATTLSTPCTAPFLGAAMGFAFAQSNLVVIGIFFAAGLGMSLPYIVLTAKPDWMKFLPKPGAWMEKFKESMGFVLLGTVVWLLSVLSSQVGSEGIMWVSFFLLAVSLSSWISGRFIDLSSSTKRKIVVLSISLAISLIAGYICLIDKPIVMSALQGKPIYKSGGSEANSEGSNWILFTPERLDQELAKKQTILLDFTADWCLTCKMNETLILNSAVVKKTIKDKGIITIKADWTRGDIEITKLLKKFKRSGVPLYVVYPKGDANNPIVLPEILTEQLLLDALNK
ncbi:MAG: protein-disulfide reductase DsbD family protein [Candidatus Melainabacteria bacterium]|nr:protein-disulfide reductase DsbD family protein [Candidatus Melainabacteria bacterium]